MNKTFYLAGSYSQRTGLKIFAELIENLSDWKCNARWLDGDHDNASAQKCAMDDIEDLQESDVFILRHGKSSAGGMWVELGMAMAKGRPIILYMPDDALTIPPPVFAFITGVQWVVTPEQIRGLLRQYEDVL